MPSAKMLTFYRTEPFSITAQYTDDSDIPATASKHIGGFPGLAVRHEWHSVALVGLPGWAWLQTCWEIGAQCSVGEGLEA